MVLGSRNAATQSFLFGLKIASSETDREALARQYLAATSNVSTADRQGDTSLQALTQLAAQSIIARVRSEPGSAFLSTFSLARAIRKKKNAASSKLAAFS